ncbi:MAG: RidA family protein [Phycisphaerae bacterium]|nr:RidA family protein [Phycisphaerae bacterium]
MPGRIDERLAALGITLPPTPKPVAAYIPTKRSGNLVFVSGQVPMRDGALMAAGLVGREVSLTDAAACARRCAINALAALKGELGDLDRVRSVVKVSVFVACEATFTEHPKVANGASEFLREVFGEPGTHARAAVGCASLPLGAPVEVEMVVEVA